MKAIATQFNPFSVSGSPNRKSKMREVQEWLGWHRAALIIVALLVLYRRLSSERPVSVVLTEPQFHPFGPDGTPAMPPLSADDYTRLIDLKDFRFDVNSLPCDSAPAGLLLIVIVASNPLHFENRRVIRATWGRSAESSRLVFLVGESRDAQVARRVTEESGAHGDIVRGSFLDAYRNMTYKHVMGLKWVAYHCPQARYILKVDDDVFVNSVGLRKFLAREIGPWGSRDLIACQVMEKSPVQRSFRSKWRLSPAEYPQRYFPTYCMGWAVIYSADAAHRLYVEAQNASYFWIDDVHMTGTLAEHAKIPRTNIKQLQLSTAQVHMLTTFHYNPARGEFLFGPPDVSVSLITDLWNVIPAVSK